MSMKTNGSLCENSIKKLCGWGKVFTAHIFNVRMAI